MAESLTEAEREVYEERAAIMEFDGGLCREEAEADKKQRWDRTSTGTTCASICEGVGPMVSW